MRMMIVLSVLFGFISQVSAFSGEELVKHRHPVAPTQLQSPPHKVMRVQRFAVSDQEPMSLTMTAQNVVRAIGSEQNKQIVIIWSDKASEKSAKRIKEKLIKRHISAKNIRLERYKGKRPIYPLLVEVKQVSGKKTPCRVDIAEDMMSFDSYVPCAMNSNQRLQRKY